MLSAILHYLKGAVIYLMINACKIAELDQWLIMHGYEDKRRLMFQRMEDFTVSVY